MLRLLTVLLLMAPFPAMAQQTDEQLWVQANATTPLGDTAEFTLESVARFGGRAGGLSDHQLGGLLDVTVAKGVGIAFGYRHVQDYDHGVAEPDEERFRQQVTVALGGGFSTRLRFEQRFHASGGEVGLRIRPSLRFTLPIGKDGLALFASHEDFLNFNTTAWGQATGYERMRNSAGVTIPLSPTLKGDLGYLNQYRFGRGGARDQMNHIATLALTLSL